MTRARNPSRYVSLLCSRCVSSGDCEISPFPAHRTCCRIMLSLAQWVTTYFPVHYSIHRSKPITREIDKNVLRILLILPNRFRAFGTSVWGLRQFGEPNRQSDAHFESVLLLTRGTLHSFDCVTVLDGN